MVAVAIGMGLVFVTGVMVGVVLMVATATRKKDRPAPLTEEPQDAARPLDPAP